MYNIRVDYQTPKIIFFASLRAALQIAERRSRKKKKKGRQFTSNRSWHQSHYITKSLSENWGQKTSKQMIFKCLLTTLSNQLVPAVKPAVLTPKARCPRKVSQRRMWNVSLKVITPPNKKFDYNKLCVLLETDTLRRPMPHATVTLHDGEL